MDGKTQIQALLQIINTAAHDALVQYSKSGQDIPLLDSTDGNSLDAMIINLPLKRAIRLLEGACDQLCATLAPPAHTIANRVIRHEIPCIRVATELHIADVLLDYPNGLHVNELASRVNVDAGKLSHIMRLLGTGHCFREVDTDVFANNRLSLVLLSSNRVRDCLNMISFEAVKSSSVLLEAVTDPEYKYSYDPHKSAFMYAVKNEGVQGGFFDWLDAHPERRENFGKSMIGFSEINGFDAVLHHYPWIEATTVCDVGSGIGAFSLPLVKMYPHVTTTLHDLPDVLMHAQEVWATNYPEAIQGNRVAFLPLDFFKDIPAEGQDIYYLRSVMHDWPDKQAKIILQQIRKAMKPHSRVLIHDYLLQHLHTHSRSDSTPGMDLAPEPLLPNYGMGNSRMYALDLHMLAISNSKERTLGSFIEITAAAGLRVERVWDLAEASLLELRLA